MSSYEAQLIRSVAIMQSFSSNLYSIVATPSNKRYCKTRFLQNCTFDRLGFKVTIKDAFQSPIVLKYCVDDEPVCVSFQNTQ